ncbi:MAG: class I SAM-dependent methyltransferase [Caldilineaceae bacterium]|nr:class I SAM-dependent methyltransferase [Caldilineaceae bacterium]
MEHQLLEQLRTAYDAMVEEYTRKSFPAWKAAERARALTMFQMEGRTTLLEIGVGAGRDSRFFQQQGLRVTCTDLSPAMVAHCRAQGLDAHVVPFDELDRFFAERRFAAIYAVNCLLHVPKAALSAILDKIHAILEPDGLFYWGQYGGIDKEGVWTGDHYRPQRFFARYTDAQFQQLPGPRFNIEAFCMIPNEVHADGDRPNCFHSLLLRKRSSL